MTTINANVFAGLTSSNPDLIARAVALINDQRLTSLESLRQELNNGTWTIRVATAADNLTDPAVFVDSIKDDHGNIIQRGQILLRSEDLARSDDPSVLKFVDNLTHEGAGHGTESAEENRLAARRRLMNENSGLSATERGDQYINTILDELESSPIAL